MPTKDELEQLYDYGRKYITYSRDWYWSSSEYVPSTTLALVVDFGVGLVNYRGKTGAYFVRPVRGGP